MPDGTPARHTNNLEHFWMPFTANRQFKAAPRLMVAAKDMHYTDDQGRQILDAAAGMWCVNAGHGRDKITEAIRTQAGIMDYAPAFQWGHSGAFDLSSRLANLFPGDLDYVFYANSGSEAVDTALKLALAYHQLRGDARRTRLIGRERGYHGVGIGGTSVGGISNNRKHFGNLMAGTDHLPHTHNLAEMAFTRGQPEWGTHLASDLERIIALHDASTIAAVIIEPVAGSTGVLVPPKGYLEKIRSICNDHGILLIFDEVITGFGRLGDPFAADYFGIVPDLMTMAKGLTNGAVPMSAIAARGNVYNTFMQGPPHMIELFHGYTYSAHPLACAAALATLDVFAEEDLFNRSRALASIWENSIHSIKGQRNVIDIRNLGMMGAIELAPRDDAPATRAYDVYLKCYEKGLLVRQTGDIIAMSPPLIASEAQVGEIISILGEAISETE
ncbi:MAG: Beta-alanine--pyruvate aminotransferase [Alphaproteobacteria bacterium MarineAlpha11_Bin1]|nr:MAG: Beta-alanine--pyruvate aminotransferase [Alphaproteobacteria bacterium MarineAlpha11_Bin1]|tara:strand:+ start:3547 stop:4878 length:1332 start_codon:yes stop_codon:yes gene_type:complete